jgi:hypothetical protein
MRARRSARGKERGKECYGDEYRDRDSELSGAGWFHLVQKCTQESRRSECREEARECADTDKPQTLAEYIARDTHWLMRESEGCSATATKLKM